VTGRFTSIRIPDAYSARDRGARSSSSGRSKTGIDRSAYPASSARPRAPWANNLLFRLAGSPPPVSGGGGQAIPPREAEGRAAPLPDNLDQVWARADEQVPTWRSITARLPARAGAPVTFTIVDARSWNPFARSQLTVNAATATVSKWDPYDATSRGQKWRGWVRFGHTGELGGVLGQIIAGLACLGATVLVWTGLSLAFRRMLAWRRPASRAVVVTR
jgi:uncharacterized iron-regulated membrane protein